MCERRDEVVRVWFSRKQSMDIWRKMIILPVRRVWRALYARLNSTKNGAGLLKLEDDVQTCEYEDIQVMWEMLRRTESDVSIHKRKQQQQPFWRVLKPY
ncbi:uncharacterized protein LOC107482508 [Arachis duranensis]|uniref:Uncharacterized protein LOC107482508 n=1 Tax=Arachis duranensis TaxID=130453 RepID=A0A6P4CWP1_ARADU|nr:uncharacterized protein LOC107482508 [Arachis duranensis]XP_057757566.1 uncharacterized protein LOC130976671 [Arachis stenosperma]